MRIHRLVLDDFRGVEHRELLLPDTGVVVLEGANEVGKSSMLEALDMLLTEKHTSRKAAVLAVKPVHRDVPSAVEAEISTGPYRFTVRKQWHSRAGTTLTVHAPRAENLTGDEAHRRVQQILTETLDQNLWNALRMLQGGSTEAPLAGSSALAAALDAAAGSAEPESAQADRARTLYEAAADRSGQFWTATGRATGRHRTCTEELAAAQHIARTAREALDLVAADSEQHAELTRRRAEVHTALERATEQAQALDGLVADLEARRGRLDQARDEAAQAQLRAAGAADALAGRRRDVAELTVRSDAVAVDGEALDALRLVVETSRAEASAAAVVADAAGTELEHAQEAADQARDALRRSQDAATLRQVTRRLAAAAAAADEVRSATSALAEHTVDAAAVRALEAAADTLQTLRARAEASAARVVVEATAVEVTVAGERVGVAAGTVKELSATRALELDVAGFATIRVLPGADTAPVAAELERAEETLSDLLTAAGVEDVVAARAANEERRSAQAAVDLARGHLRQVTADASVEELQAEAARLSADLSLGGPALGEPALGDPQDVPAVEAARAAEAATREALRCSREAARQARTAADSAARRAETAARDLAARAAALTVARTELEAATTRLVQARRTRSDEDVENSAALAATALEAATAEVTALETDLAVRDADATLVRAAGVRADVAALTGTRDALDAELVGLQARLSVMGDEARQEAWDEAESVVQRLAEELAGLTRRAAAARLLHQTLDRHRDTQRRRYVSPFTDRLTELGRTVFGETFSIALDDDLSILDRTLEGRTVAYEHLSTGAREQLAVLTRLACATLVDPADGVPVVLDDALGHSDPARLQRLAAVFEKVAPTTQVLLVAPGPGVHSAIAGATVVRLDPAPTATSSA